VAPVTTRSVLRPCQGVRYTELAGVPVLYAPIDGRVHQVSPGVARVWAELDGRPLADLGDPPPVELARRLRVLGLVEDDRGPGDPRAEAPEVDGDDPTVVRLPGRLVERADGTAVELFEPEDLADALDVVEIDRSTGRVRPGDQPLVAIVVVDTGALARPAYEPGARVDLEPFEALQALISVLPRSLFGPIDSLDRLADLVDRVPIELGPPMRVAGT